MGGFLLAALLMVLASLAESGTTCVAFLIATCAALGLFTANVWAMTQTLAGPAAGSWTGVQNCVGNMGGVISPLVAGWSIGQTGTYQTAFYVAALVMVAGAGAYAALVGPIEPVRWVIASDSDPSLPTKKTNPVDRTGDHHEIPQQDATENLS